MNRSRPIYETAEDVANEAKVLDAAAAKFNCEWRKTPKLYPVDACFVRGKKVVAFGEVKCRDKAYDAGYMI